MNKDSKKERFFLTLNTVQGRVTISMIALCITLLIFNLIIFYQHVQVQANIQDTQVTIEQHKKITAKSKVAILQHLFAVQKGIDASRNTTVIVSFLTAFFSIFFSLLFMQHLQRSIAKPIKLLHQLARGELSEEILNSHDELGEILQAGNQLSNNLNKASNFAQCIGESKFDTDFMPASKKDILGNSLLQMRDKLKIVAEDDKKRNWATEGLAKFGEILRANSDNSKMLGDAIISSLVDYLGANQAGMFIVQEKDENEENLYLEMISCYAYNRKKYIQKKVKLHGDYAESLLGQAFLEKEKIYVVDIPDGYIHITSGLGDAPPSTILIMPLKVNDKVEGIIEIASFREMEEYEIEFVEKIGEMIASTIGSAKANEHTQKLLKEQQEQAEVMRVQEEELRENMLELNATKEEVEKVKEQELEKTQKALDAVELHQKTLLSILNNIPGKIFLKDKNGKMLLANSEMANVYNKSVNDLLGTTDSDFFDQDLARSYREQEEEIMELGAKTYIQEEEITGALKYLQTTKMPFYIDYMQETGLLGVQIDITDAVKTEQELLRLRRETKKLQKDIKRKEDTIKTLENGKDN